MSRKQDVMTIMAAANDQFIDIRKSYDRALEEKSLDLRIPVKNLMENLRSALDYMAHDIYESYCRPSGESGSRNIYFPYGLTLPDFKSMTGRSLPDLQRNNPDVYNLITSVQPFVCGDTWLYDLCSILNENKHDRLTAQTRSETKTHSIESAHGSVSIIEDNPNVRITSKPGAVRLFGIPAQFTGEGIKTEPSNRIIHKRTTWVAFTFEGSTVNVIGMLEKAVAGIKLLTKELYTKI